MKLRDLQIKSSYRTGREDLLSEFYIPVLSVSTRYDRAVGYFSSTILSHAAQGISAFFAQQQGVMRLVFGGELSLDDYEAAVAGLKRDALTDLLAADIDASIDRLVGDIKVRRLELLSFLIATGRLQIKFALRPHGIFHEKFGVLTDSHGSAIAFDGSANESAQAFLLAGNWERIRTYKSWVGGQQETVDELQADFDAIWSGREPSCITLEIPEVSKSRLVSIGQGVSGPLLSPGEESALVAAEQSPSRKVDGEQLPNEPAVPDRLFGHPFTLRAHQLQALNQWRANNFAGLAALCTGAGKTIMAIYGIVRIFEATQRLFCVIAVPYITLADQWVDVLAEFGIHPIRCWSGHDWRTRLADCVSSFMTGGRTFGCIVVVNATLRAGDLQRELQRVDGQDLVFVGDECHHHRSEALLSVLPTHARYRLGLSATPLHYRDAAGNFNLTEYYGPVVAEYTLRQALQDGVLSAYEYHPIVVELTGDEREHYLELSGQIAQLLAGGSELDDNPRLESLLRQRAEILATAENKDIQLEALLAGVQPTPLALVYCGIDSPRWDGTRQMQRVKRIFADRNWSVLQFTAQETAKERRLLLQGFGSGLFDALVAMRCLDEGIDVPGCQTAFILASASDPRQFIQRRGRLLRNAPGKKSATIYDFVVVPGSTDVWTEVDRRLVGRELSRVKEFSETASNYAEAIANVENIARAYDLLHLL